MIRNVPRDHQFIDETIVQFTYDNMLEKIFKKDEKKHYVMWSGGTDSTLLLYELLHRFGAKNVIAISYEYPWLLGNKRIQERKHRETFKAKMQLRDERFQNFTHFEIKTENTRLQGTTSYADQNGGLPQAIAWLLGCVNIVCDNSYVYTGAIRDDDLTIRREPYYQMFEGMAKLLNKSITLREPYLELHKEMVLAKLLQYDIYDTTWFCEMPYGNGQCCMKCPPCKLHLSSLTKLVEGYSRADVTKYIKIQAKIRFEELIKGLKNPNNDNESYVKSVCISDDIYSDDGK